MHLIDIGLLPNGNLALYLNQRDEMRKISDATLALFTPPPFPDMDWTPPRAPRVHFDDSDFFFD